MWDDLAAIHAFAFHSPPPWSAAELEGAATAPGGFLLREGGGFLIGRAIAGEAELLTLATHPAHRRQGIASRLVDAFLTRASAVADTAFLEVAADNSGAIRLYDAAGFANVGVRRRYYGPIDALVMRRALVTRDHG
ncbi:GNAT family N-acetyltransferase [Falsirhodobacter sp. alg1]|uniref:GNAT family N-acetyltransferase n=1 Tax=Falsirhodobacter sp. alg1 TaxID=1472418 RepID=UPI0007891937|nr:GNAT family N-acetyltransferase [Falsirhodobacter sp. alg1]